MCTVIVEEHSGQSRILSLQSATHCPQEKTQGQGRIKGCQDSVMFHETHNSKGEGLGWRAVTRRGKLVLVGVAHHQWPK